MDQGDNSGIKTETRMKQHLIRVSVYFLPFNRRLFHCTGQVSPATTAIRPRDDLGAVDEMVAAAR